MYYKSIDSVQELNKKVTDYVTMGFTIISVSSVSANSKAVKYEDYWSDGVN